MVRFHRLVVTALNTSQIRVLGLRLSYVPIRDHSIDTRVHILGVIGEPALVDGRAHAGSDGQLHPGVLQH